MKIEEEYNYMTPDERMIAAQGKVINDLRRDIDRDRDHMIKLQVEAEAARNDARMYRAIQEAVQAHEPLQDIWNDLVVTMKLLEIKF